jgi:glycosyltransferase involved in cell wall biosynthesis
MQLSISTPYRANSIVNIARAAVVHEQLQRFYTTLYLAGWAANVERLPFFGAALANELGRRAFPGIPSEAVVNVAMFPELIQVGSRRVLGKYWPMLAADLMQRAKAQFDSAVARRLHREPPDVLLGMNGASLESFRAIHEHGGLAVLNFVNSHPAEHNRYLLDLAKLQAPHHELIPDWYSRRIETELKLADLILVPSLFVSDQLVAHGVSSEKIATLPYGVNLRDFHPPQKRESGRRMLECLYVGHISHRKGVRMLLQAARRCQDLPVKFRLIGPMVSREVLDGLPDNVIYEGPSFPGGVADAMRHADLFVLPTIEDSFALVVFEAMSSALPVITTNHAGSSEMIEDGQDGLIVPAGNEEALTQAIRLLVGDPDMRLRMGDAARKKVLGAHSWEAYGKSVLKAINDCSRGATSKSESMA